jgi:hypothetical protein
MLNLISATIYIHEECLSLSALMMEVLSSSETSALTRAAPRNIAEDGILHSHRRENLKSYVALTGWTL